jgi:hypothetical protein
MDEAGLATRRGAELMNIEGFCRECTQNVELAGRGSMWPRLEPRPTSNSEF